MEYYLAIRTDEISPVVTTWVDLEDSMLSELSQTEKVKNHMISLIWDIKLKTTSKQEKQMRTHRHRQQWGDQMEGGGRRVKKERRSNTVEDELTLGGEHNADNVS